MAKLIVLVLGLLAVFWLLRAYRRRVDRDAPDAAAARDEDMVRCAGCGLHLPRGESVAADGRYFCCPEHERAHRAERQP